MHTHEGAWDSVLAPMPSNPNKNSERLIISITFSIFHTTHHYTYHHPP